MSNLFDRVVRCPCCDAKPENTTFLRDAIDAMDAIPGAVITSGFRCSYQNERIGGHPKSMHVQGLAVDVSFEDSNSRWRILRWAFENDYSIGWYSRHIHIDDRPSTSKAFVGSY